MRSVFHAKDFGHFKDLVVTKLYLGYNRKKTGEAVLLRFSDRIIWEQVSLLCREDGGGHGYFCDERYYDV